jgi:hypothetical protein
MKNKLSIGCTLVFVVNQGKIPHINPLQLLEKGVIDKKQASTAQFNVMLGGVCYEDDDIRITQELNRIVIGLKSEKTQGQDYLQSGIVALSNFFDDFLAIGVNFSCRIPMPPRALFYNKENPLYKNFNISTDLFGANIVAAKEGYTQNISFAPDKAKNEMLANVNNHFPKQKDDEKFSFELALLKFAELKGEFTEMLDELSSRG